MSGLPCLVISLNRKLAIVSLALSAIALASGHFVKKSVHVMHDVLMYVFPETVQGSGSMRSIPIRCQGLSQQTDRMERGSWLHQLLVDPCITCLNIPVN